MGCSRSFWFCLSTVALLQVPTIQADDFVKTVHVIYMNHLDVGYDGIPIKGFINNVLNTYFNEYFPRAVWLSKQLTDGGYVETFKYTTHPWLVSMYLNCPQNFTLAGVTLKCPNASHLANFTSAVKAGYITWHAGSMNIQAENNVPWLFDFGLKLGEDLDTWFGINRKMKVISQRDVPGMTQSVIPSLVKHNIIGVSVGVNPGTAPPAVPQMFRWKYQNNEVLGTWHPGGYPLNPGQNPIFPGGLSRRDCVVIPNYSEALCYAFRTDNSGPPIGIQEILGYYEILRAEFPNAVIKASTFEDYFIGVKSIQDKLPIVTGEIGDTWINGIASDPRKVAEFRAVARVLGECSMQGKCDLADKRVYNASRLLTKLPEHTWGLNSVYDSGNWSNANFHKYMKGDSFVNSTKSWLEQRNFTYMAIDALQNLTVVDEINAELNKIKPGMPDLEDFMPLSPVQWQKDFQCDADIVIGFGMDGSIDLLSYKGTKWASLQYPMAKFMYNSYNKTDSDALDKVYEFFGGPGFDKFNVTLGAHPESRSWPVALRDMYIRSDGSCDFYLHLEMVDKRTWMYYGAPQGIWIRHTVRKGTARPGVDTVFQWFDKTSTRLPESLMLSFTSTPMAGYKWTMSKLGHIIDPTNVILNGSQYQHAVDDGGLYYMNSNSSGLHIYSPDVSLVGPMTVAKKPPVVYPSVLKPITETIIGMAYTFYNNVWDTNYILWYPYIEEDKDFKARFSVEFV